MSTVYKARAPVTNRIVALKILQPRDDIFIDLVGEERLREIFMEEARIMGGITHDHVAKIIDCDSHNGVPFIVLEYFSHSIGEFIGEAYKVEQPTRKISVPRTFVYISQALKGLERLHFAGIIHRDIKPYNLMITNDDRVKIIDFGLSRVRGEEKVSIPGMQVGSPYYAAPEQGADPKKADVRSDLYSLGVLTYRMLTGKLFDQRQKTLPVASNENSDLSTEWDHFIHRAIDRKPDNRFSTAVEMRLVLEETFLQWQMSKKQRCSIPKGEAVPQESTKQQIPSQPKRIMYKDVREQLKLDELLRPRHFNSHQLTVYNQQLLYDPETRLYWQRNGAGFTLDWQQAKEYVDHLNASNFEGKSTWRLPTTSELVTVLRPPTPHRDFCVDPHFLSSIHWLWSSDHCTKKSAWMADIVESYIGRLDMDGTASVCGVTS